MPKEYHKLRQRITEEPIMKTLLWLGIPPLITQLVQVSYNIVDTIWLSRLSDIDIAVPRQSWPPLMVVFMLGISIQVANLSLISQLIGAKRYKEAEEAIGRIFYIMLIMGIALGFIFISLRNIIFGVLLETPQEILSKVLDYSFIVGLGVPFYFMSIAFTTVLQAIGDTRTPMIIQTVSAITNIILDPFLIFGIGFFPAMGITGAAVATLLSRILSALLGSLILIKGHKGIKATFPSKLVTRKWVTYVIKVGGPVGVLRIANALSFSALLKIVNTFGIVAATTYSLGFIIINLSDAILWGFTRALSIMIGQNLGAGKTDRAKEIVEKSSITIILGTIVLTVVVYFATEPLVYWFVQTPAIRLEAVRFIRIFLLSIPFFAAFFISVAIGNGSGHTIVPSTIGVIRLWGIRIGLSYITAIYLGLGLVWVWISMTLSNVFAGIAGLLWVLSWKWVKPRIREYFSD